MKGGFCLEHFLNHSYWESTKTASSQGLCKGEARNHFFKKKKGNATFFPSVLIAECFVFSNVLPAAFVGELLAACQGQTVNQIFCSHLHNETLKNLPEPKRPSGPSPSPPSPQPSLRSQASVCVCVTSDCAPSAMVQKCNKVCVCSTRNRGRSTAVSAFNWQESVVGPVLFCTSLICTH